MPTVLITGAGRGLGLEFARQYAADSWRIHATTRRPCDTLAAIKGEITVHTLDVTDEGALKTLAAKLAGEPVDLVINNAGVLGNEQRLAHLALDDWRHELEVNTLAPFAVTRAFLPHVRAGSGKTIASLTSRMGSIADNTGGGYYAYRSSKAALNAVMKSLAIDLAREGIKVCVLHPGWAQTDMGGPHATVPTAQAVASMRNVIANLSPARSGDFFNYDGEPLPW